MPNLNDAPPTADAILRGYNLRGLTPVQSGVRREIWVDGTESNPVVHARFSYQFVTMDDPDSLVYPWNTTLPAPWAGMLFRRATIEDGDVGEHLVTFIYEDVGVASLTIGVNQTVIELDVGKIERPLALHPRYADLTVTNLADVQRMLTDSIKVSDDGTNLSVWFTGTSTGGPADVIFTGVDDTTGANDTGTVREYALKMLRGESTYDHTTAVFVKTIGYRDYSFSTIMTKMNRLQYPGFGLPGSAYNWKRDETRVYQRGNVNEVSQRWEYLGDIEDSSVHWDRAIYRLA